MGLFYLMSDITSKLAGYDSLGDDVNKTSGTTRDEQAEGVVSTLLPELDLDMSDEELKDLSKRWRKDWNSSPKKAKLEKAQAENEKYWLGKHFGETIGDERPLVDNLIFESLEEALPVATKENPEPTVAADNTEEGKKLATDVQKMLVYLSDKLALKLKIKRATRYWALYRVGVAQIHWDQTEDEIGIDIHRPQKLVLDADAEINEVSEYQGKYLGKAQEDTATDLKKKFPKKAKFIDEETQKEAGTKLRYTEWWTNDYLFWEMGDEILGKTKNPHFNYESKKSQTIDEMGMPKEVETPPRNHFKNPKMPFVFLSIFNLGKQPFDETSLIEQNLPLQDLVNKRFSQIDRNADKMNGGSVWSGDVMTSEQAKQADEAIRHGGSVIVPGDVNRNHAFVEANPLPPDVFNQLADTRNELKNIFGTRGLGAAGVQQEKTVRGKIMTAQADSSRIGGGISEYLEQFADHIFNHIVQFIYVYWDEPHEGSVLGQAKAFEYVSLSSAQLDRNLTVSVKPGSLIPHDTLTEANQAVDLASAGLMDPITLYSRLDFPNPKEMAKNLFLWKTNPMMLFPELAQEMAAQNPQAPPGGGGGPGAGPPGGPQPGQPPAPNPADALASQATPSLNQVPISGAGGGMPNI